MRRRVIVDTAREHQDAIERYRRIGLDVVAQSRTDGQWTTLVRPGCERRASQPWWQRMWTALRIDAVTIDQRLP